MSDMSYDSLLAAYEEMRADAKKWHREALDAVLAESESEVSAWLAYICSVQGHVVNGLGYGTNAEAVVWDNHCSRCGVKLRGSESE